MRYLLPQTFESDGCRTFVIGRYSRASCACSTVRLASKTCLGISIRPYVDGLVFPANNAPSPRLPTRCPLGRRPPRVHQPTVRRALLRARCPHPLDRALGDALAYYTGSSTIAACLILAGSLLTVVVAIGDAIVPQLKFIWHCFLRPLGATDQRTRLDKVRALSPLVRFLIAVCVPVLQGPSGRV